MRGRGDVAPDYREQGRRCQRASRKGSFAQSRPRPTFRLYTVPSGRSYPQRVSRHPLGRRKMLSILAVLGSGPGYHTVVKGATVQKGKIVEQALAAFSDPASRERYFDLYAPGIVLHGYDGVDPGLESVRSYYAAFWTAFPDARVTAEDILEIQDKVVVRFLITGTHRGPILGLGATGKSIRLAGMTILRFEGQKCLERWSVTDSLSLAMQLGAFPGPK